MANNNVSFKRKGSIDSVVTLVERALIDPTVGERLLPTKPRLSGKIDPPNVRLHRARGGTKMHAEFQGTIEANGGSVVIEGEIRSLPSPLCRYVAPPTAVLGLLWLLVSLPKWPAGESIAHSFIGVGCLGAAAVIWRLCKLNVDAEKELLSQAIEDAVNETNNNGYKEHHA